jgi:hypothetical protein
MDDTLKQIFTIINWYRGLAKDFNSIDDLIYSRKQLSTHGVDLASFVGELKADFETAYFNRKLQYAKAITKHKVGISVAEAESLAMDDIKNVYEDEKTLEGQHGKGRLILNQVNEVLSSMQQHLSYLKDEKKSESIRQTT